MSEDLKEDIINDINRLLSKESPMHGNIQENHHNQQMNELSPQAIAHMQKQIHQHVCGLFVKRFGRQQFYVECKAQYHSPHLYEY